MAYTVKQLAEACAADENGRSAWMDRMAAQAIELDYTVATLEENGSARQFIVEVLKARNELLGTTNKDGKFDASKSEVSKWCTISHPKVRVKVAEIRETAKIIAVKHGDRVDNAIFKLAKHLKTDEVSTVETAVAKAEVEYGKKKDSVDVTTHDGFKTSATGKFKTSNAKKLFTEASLAAVIVAIAALEAVKVSPPATVTPIGAASPEAPQDIASILSGINSMDLPAADKVALIQQLIAAK